MKQVWEMEGLDNGKWLGRQIDRKINRQIDRYEYLIFM